MNAPAPEPAPAQMDEDRWLRAEVLPHQTALLRFLRGRYPSICDPEDLVQEAILRAIRVRREGKLRAAKPFLFQTARNLALDLIRHFGRAPDDTAVAMLGWASTEETPCIAESACRRQELDFLSAAIETLPPHCRLTFRLRRLEEVPLSETARQLGVCEQTVSNHVATGLNHCADFLERHGLRGSADGQELAG